MLEGSTLRSKLAYHGWTRGLLEAVFENNRLLGRRFDEGFAVLPIAARTPAALV